MKDDLFKDDDDDITKVGSLNFYSINEQTYQFYINYDSQIGYYSARLSIDLRALHLGEYRLVFEMYFNTSKIDKNQIVVNRVSSTLNISRNTTNKFENHTRIVVTFHKYGNIGIID